MDQATVFTKTAKGITQVNQRSASLSKDLMKVLKLIDGKSHFAQIMEKAELDKNQLEKALNTLTKDGFARVFQTKKEELDPFGDEGGGGGDDFDFTAPGNLDAEIEPIIEGFLAWLRPTAVGVMLLDVGTRRIAWDRLIGRRFGQGLRGADHLPCGVAHLPHAKGAPGTKERHEQRTVRDLAYLHRDLPKPAEP